MKTKLPRDFHKVSEKELLAGVVRMLDDLNICGSLAGEYDLYQAIFKEHDKSVALNKK